ncbi:hypothetical protein Mal15_62610 [Stieleria maiorica]|uniref:Uncharacterized protein n=1 Tax=Stieleria maiorica TaxID=2795974 RepID=A0A5B9MQY4_9BACT|nr:hypothetical protein Mal15_62610 [Stieleria maiorica]
MQHVHPNLIFFTIYTLFACLSLPVLELIPPKGIVHPWEWVFLPFTLFPCVSIFGNRLDRVEAAYPYLVVAGTTAIALWFLSRLATWAFVNFNSG